ncbi:MAG TPA: hypothetical protein VL283_05490 [Candidatus Baltobacteraceae bacterium]|jgi:hypothetical protein|nr:hypothetical protein [Candidatus Baltobacteraceae bacterium]
MYQIGACENPPVATQKSAAFPAADVSALRAIARGESGPRSVAGVRDESTIGSFGASSSITAASLKSRGGADYRGKR